MLPSIPRDVAVIVIERLVRYVSDAIRDFIHDDLPRLAKEQEDKLNAQLLQAHVGDKFLSQPIIAETADTITVLVRFVDVGIPGIENVKLRLVRAALEIERRVNLTTSTMPPIFVRHVPAATIEILETAKTHEIAIGGGFDEPAGFQQYRAGVRWETPEVYFRGFLAVRDKGGFLIDLFAQSEFCFPLGPSGVGLKGAGVLYGEHFAPDLRDPGSVEPVIARMERASADDYVAWARKNDLERWAPVDQGIRTFGVSTSLCDVLSSGDIVLIEEAGIAFIDYGPIIVFGGRLKILKTTDVGDLLGAIDVRSRSFFGRATISLDVIPWAPGAISFKGVNELSASLRDQDKTWWAVGGYQMDACRLKILGFLELWGGMRIVPLQGAAVRGAGRAEGQIEFIGTGAGYSLAIDASARFGYNPFALGGNLRVSGDAWLKILGQKLGAGISADIAMQLPKPLELRLDVEFRLSLPWPLGDKTFGATVFNLSNADVRPADAPIAIAAGDALPYIHGPSGTLGQLVDADTKVWPDVAFDLAFQRSAGGPRMIVNPPSLGGVHQEGGVSVAHRIGRLEIAKLDPSGNETVVPGVSASWLLSKSAGGTAATSRLAIPCNDPLGWLNRFDYAQPDTVQPLEPFVLQTFGGGAAETFAVDSASGLARVHVERLIVDCGRPLNLSPTPWASAYGRLLTNGQRYTIQIAGPEPGGSMPLAVQEYEVRVIQASEHEPFLNVSGGTVTGASIVQRFANGTTEWVVAISRQRAEYRDPLRVGNGDNFVSLAAVGYRLDGMADVDGGTLTVFEPGRYRLHLEGVSDARRSNSAKQTGWTPIVRDFEVIRPPLRPYLKFATFGDERIFGVAVPGWNPNPYASSFGHYQDHLGLIRSRVSYLSKIYDRLWISPRDDMAPTAIQVQAARDGTLAGARGTQDWEIATGQAPSREEEVVLPLPPDPGQARARIYFSVSGDGADIDLSTPLDEWTYRVSRYANPTAHLKPGRDAFSWAYGPFGARAMSTPQGPGLPADFDFAASPPAKLTGGWALPTEIARLAALGDASAGLGFLKLLEWAGVFHVPTAASENILAPASAPELSLLLDTATSPVGLVLHTSEPCDWRRVDATVVVGDPAGVHARLSARLAPSGDGCACILLLEADGVAVRVPSGLLALEVRFAFARAGLPRLTPAADPDQVAEQFNVSIEQPYGRAWPL
ncbi:hypothetical protein C8J38_11248 [Rhizobium sp. PP-WC-2G-219]|nr:hypothetical protein C8J38_11248 [Rhizobium sp. PP-WC-2G-219]